MNYVRYVMPVILKEEDMQVFCLEIQGWLDNSGYKPIGRNWKWREDAKVKVKHLDLRHLIWNIAVPYLYIRANNSCLNKVKIVKSALFYILKTSSSGLIYRITCNSLIINSCHKRRLYKPHGNSHPQ